MPFDSIQSGLIVLLLASGAVLPALAAQSPPNVLVVTGDGVERVATTRVEVRLGVETNRPTADEAHADVADRAASVVALLEKAGVTDLTTTGVRLQPRYSYKNGRQQLTGYAASNNVSFRMDTEGSGQLIDRAVQAGASQIQGVTFIAPDDELERARTRALAAAAVDAQAQADAVLAALGLERQWIRTVRVGHASPAPPPVMMRQAAMAESATTPIEGGDQEVRATVTLEVVYRAARRR